MVSLKYLWTAALQEIFNNCSNPISFASEDIAVLYSFRFRLEFSFNSCRYSCMAFNLTPGHQASSALALSSSPWAYPHSPLRDHPCGLSRVLWSDCTRPRRVIPPASSVPCLLATAYSHQAHQIHTGWWLPFQALCPPRIVHSSSTSRLLRSSLPIRLVVTGVLFLLFKFLSGEMLSPRRPLPRSLSTLLLFDSLFDSLPCFSILKVLLGSL